MATSKDELYLKLSGFKNKYCILGKGNGFFLIPLLSSLKSDMKQTVEVFYGIINEGAVHSELFLRFKRPIFTNLLSLTS